MTRETLSSVASILDNERCKLGSFEDLLSTLIEGADAIADTHPFYALLEYVQPITRRIAEAVEQLEAGQEPDPVADPAVIANAAYQAVEDEINDTPGDVSDELSDAMAASYRACMATQPTTLAGVTAKLRAHVRWTDADNSEGAVLAATLLADLERLTGKEVRS